MQEREYEGELSSLHLLLGETKEMWDSHQWGGQISCTFSTVPVGRVNSRGKALATTGENMTALNRENV